MNSRVLSYKLPMFTGLIDHGSSETFLLRDWNLGHSNSKKDLVDVQIRSGDYFVTLATILDSLASNIDTYTTRAEIENIVSDLIYLQDNYTITKQDAYVPVNRD